jgi:hypothetical protein
VKTALELLKKNEKLTMNELAFDMKQKYSTFDITPQHLGHVIRDNNQTRKEQDTNISQKKDTRNQ